MLHHEEFGMGFRGKGDQVITVRSDDPTAEQIDRFCGIYPFPVEVILHIECLNAGFQNTVFDEILLMLIDLHHCLD